MDVYECDVCGKPESEVDHLKCGRTQGWDYQICLGCRTRYQAFTGVEIVTLLRAMKDQEKPTEDYWKG